MVYPEKQQAFLNISLTTNTVADRISDLSVGLDSQLKNGGKAFIAFSVAIDEGRCFFNWIFSKNLCFTINSDVVFVLFWTVLKQRKQSEVVVFKLYTRMLLVQPAW